MTKEATTLENLSRSRARVTLCDVLGEPGVGMVALGTGQAPSAATRPATAGEHKGPKRIPLDSASAYRLIKRGISSKAIAPLGEFLGLGKATVAAYLDLDRGTANRRAAKDQLLPTHAAEAVVRLLDLDQMAGDTFETQAEASEWLRKPHPMLDAETPLEAARTGYGAQRVKDILLAIRYGGVV